MDLPPLPAPQYIEISKLKVLPRNPQTITEKEFAKLRKSVRDNPDYFAVRPCLVNSASGELIVYAGNKRLLAAIQEGYDKVPCTVESLTPAQLLKYDEAGRPRRYHAGCNWRKGRGKRNAVELIICKCGCGGSLNRYDRYGRMREYLPFHKGRRNYASNL
jgi:hypothetical protein